MKIEADKIVGYRLRAHHLDKKIPMNDMIDAAGVCGLQNTPPGSWETSLFNRLDKCTLHFLHNALYEEKILLQAWSYRGVPVVFPTEQSDIFLTPLIAQEGEQPWIYTKGITGALDHLQISFDDALVRVRTALKYLDGHTIKSKEALDRILANIVQEDLPENKQALWCDPSMYGNPDKQTVGAAAVSFLLRPCSFHSLVVFGERQKTSPTFTSFKNWIGHAGSATANPDKELARKYVHCYGPTTVEHLKNWLGSTPQQAQRIWSSILDEMEPIEVEGETSYLLSKDRNSLMSAERDSEKLLLLGAHDPYLDMKDRTIILQSKALHKTVWRFVANPGAVLKGGRIIGTWKATKQSGKLAVVITAWEKMTSLEQKNLKDLAEEYASFRLLPLESCEITF